MATTFKNIVDDVLSDRFAESQRGSAKRWVNHRYGWLLSLEPWSFLRAKATVQVTQGSGTIASLPTDIGLPSGLYLSDGTKLQEVAYEDFLEAYVSTDTGSPLHYSYYAGVLYVGPIPVTTDAACTLLYQSAPPELVDDNDEPVVPELFRFALVHGGAAEGLKLQNDPTWQAFEQDFSSSIDAMRRLYLVEARDSHAQFGAWEA